MLWLSEQTRGVCSAFSHHVALGEAGPKGGEMSPGIGFRGQRRRPLPASAGHGAAAAQLVKSKPGLAHRRNTHSHPCGCSVSGDSVAVLTASGSREQSHGASRTWPGKRDRRGISKIDGKTSSLQVSVLGRVLQSENPGAGLQGRPQGQAEEGTDVRGTSCPFPPGGAGGVSN